jgi:hypothetical protein
MSENGSGANRRSKARDCMLDMPFRQLARPPRSVAYMSEERRVLKDQTGLS